MSRVCLEFLFDKFPAALSYISFFKSAEPFFFIFLLLLDERFEFFEWTLDPDNLSYYEFFFVEILRADLAYEVPSSETSLIEVSMLLDSSLVSSNIGALPFCCFNLRLIWRVFILYSKLTRYLPTVEFLGITFSRFAFSMPARAISCSTTSSNTSCARLLTFCRISAH